MPFGQRGTPRREIKAGVSLAALAAAAAVLFGASAASAEPSIQEKRRQAELILAQVQELDGEVGAAAERFNGANYQLAQLGERLRRTRTDLNRARKQLGTARGRASERLVQLYLNGSGPSTLEVMLGSESLSDLLDQLEVSQRILEQDTRIATDLKQLAARTKQRERQLATSRATQADLVRNTLAAVSQTGGLMGIIAFVILGLVAGAIAKALLPGDAPGGFIVTAIIGVVGAIVGGFLAGALFDADPLDDFFDISTWLTAIVGSIVLLVIYRAVTKRGVGRART